MSTVTTLPNGSTVQKLADGTKISTSANGTVLKVLPDGTKIQTTKDGVELIVRPDGTKEQKNARGVLVVTYPDGRTVQTNPDGVRIEISADKKTRLQKNADGSEILVRPDGSKLQKLSDGTEIEISVDGKKTKKMLSRDQTPGEAAAVPPALPPSRTLPREVPPAIVSSNVSKREAELAHVTSIAQAKRESERADRAERELEQLKRKVVDLETKLSKSEDAEAVSKAAQEHAKLVVRIEAEKDKLVEEKKETDLRMAKMKELVDGAEAQRNELIAKHTEAVKQLEVKLEQQTKEMETLKAELATVQAEVVTAKQVAEASESKALEAEVALVTLNAEKESLMVERNRLQDEIHSLEGKVNDIITKGTSAADKVAELKFQKATAEERATRYQEEAAQLKNELAELKSKVETNQTEQVKTAADTAAQQADVAKTLETDLEILMNAKEQAEMELMAQKGEVERLQMELDAANMTMSQMKDEASAKEATTEMAALRKRMEDAERLSITASEKIDQLERECVKLRLENSDLKLRVALGDGPANTPSSTVQTSAESSDQSASASAPAPMVSASALEEESAKLYIARDEIEQLKRQLNEANAKARKAENDKDFNKKELDIRLSALEKERLDLAEKVKGSQGSGKSKGLLGFGKKDSKKSAGGGETVEELRADLVDAHHTLLEKEKECEILEVQLKKAESDKEIELEELRTKLRIVEDTLKERKDELEQIRTKTTGANASAAVIELQNEVSLLKTRLELAATAKQSMEDHAKECERRATEAEAKVAGDANVEKVTGLERTIAEKQAEIAALQQNIITSETDKEAALAEVARLNAAIAASQADTAEVVRLQTALATVQAERDTLANEVAVLKSAAKSAPVQVVTSAGVPPKSASPPPVVLTAAAPAPVETSSGSGTDFLSQLRAKQVAVTTGSASPVATPKTTTAIPGALGTGAQKAASPKGNSYVVPNYSVPSSGPKPGAAPSYLPKATTATPSWMNKTTPATTSTNSAAASSSSAASTSSTSSKIADMKKRFEKQ